MPNKHTNEEIEAVEKWFVDIMDDFCCGNCQPLETKCFQSRPEYKLIQTALQSYKAETTQTDAMEVIINNCRLAISDGAPFIKLDALDIESIYKALKHNQEQLKRVEEAIENIRTYIHCEGIDGAIGKALTEIRSMM